MKIYNKKNFIIGLLGELLLIALFTFRIRRGESISFLQVCTLLMWLIAGGRIIFRSLSKKHAREDLVLERDERNLHIRLKVSRRGLQITQAFCFIGGIALYYFGSDNYNCSLLGSGLFIALVISCLAELGAAVWYERRS